MPVMDWGLDRSQIIKPLSYENLSMPNSRSIMNCLKHFLLSLLFYVIPSCCSFCKSTPGTPDWPSAGQWASLNSSLSGRLLQPTPPAAVCHPNLSVYDDAACSYIQSQWPLQAFHSNNPISVDSNNWSNDTCLPSPLAPCTADGYPVYVVNASTAEDVKCAINFARKHHIRLNVKGSGHDYLGRYFWLWRVIMKPANEVQGQLHRIRFLFGPDIFSERSTTLLSLLKGAGA